MVILFYCPYFRRYGSYMPAPKTDSSLSGRKIIHNTIFLHAFLDLRFWPPEPCSGTYKTRLIQHWLSIQIGWCTSNKIRSACCVSVCDDVECYHLSPYLSVYSTTLQPALTIKVHSLQVCTSKVF